MNDNTNNRLKNFLIYGPQVPLPRESPEPETVITEETSMEQAEMPVREEMPAQTPEAPAFDGAVLESLESQLAEIRGMLEELGYRTSPGSMDPRSDIVQIVELGSPEKLCRFCRGIQFGAPVDSFAAPVPAPMPGYEDEVVMASGSFIQGSTIELSADGPMREPYAAYLQGGLTYESGRLGIMYAISEMLDA